MQADLRAELDVGGVLDVAVDTAHHAVDRRARAIAYGHNAGVADFLVGALLMRCRSRLAATRPEKDKAWRAMQADQDRERLDLRAQHRDENSALAKQHIAEQLALPHLLQHRLPRLLDLCAAWYRGDTTSVIGRDG